MSEELQKTAVVEPAPTKVIVYDRDPGLLERLIAAISAASEVRIVGRTSDQSKLEGLFVVQKPDVAVLRLPPEPQAFRLVREVKSKDPYVALIVLSNSPSIIYHKEWKKAGVDFYFDTAEAVQFLPDFFSWKRRTFHNDSFRNMQGTGSDRA